MEQISNEALWGKLSEIDKKLSQHLKEQKESVQTQGKTDISPQLKANKEGIIEIFKKGIQGLGTHCDSHFKAIHKNIEQLERDTEGIYKILSCISAILKETQEQSVIKSDNKKSYLNFKFFKLRKSSIVIAVLGLLVFILTLFCMKQQNDYTLLIDEYYKKIIVLKNLK